MKNKTLGVMCCGCYRMMMVDGKALTGMRKGPRGVPEPISEVSTSDIAWFASKAEADEAAKKFGWSTEDREGANHRCPDCQKELGKPSARMVAQRGAYIDRSVFSANRAD